MQISSCTSKGFQIGPIFCTYLKKTQFQIKLFGWRKEYSGSHFNAAAMDAHSVCLCLCAQTNFRPFLLVPLQNWQSEIPGEPTEMLGEHANICGESQADNIIAEATALTIGGRSDSQNLTRSCRPYQMQNAAKTNTTLVFVQTC